MEKIDIQRLREQCNSIEICEYCMKDKNIVCPRNVDVECLICHKRICAGHIKKHLKEHCIVMTMIHCRRGN